MSQDIWWQLSRYLLQIVGTYLFTRGLITKEVGALLYSEATIGALMTLGSMAWGFYVKWRTKAVPTSVVERKDLPSVNAATGAIVPPRK